MGKIEMHEIADVLNTINLALQEKGFEATGYETAGDVLMVMIERAQTIITEGENG